jgi:hypothetical protein
MKTHDAVIQDAALSGSTEETHEESQNSWSPEQDFDWMNPEWITALSLI